jgi:hypothetical protein
MAPERAGRSSEGEGARRPENGAQRCSQNLYRVVHIASPPPETGGRLRAAPLIKEELDTNLRHSPGLKL